MDLAETAVAELIQTRDRMLALLDATPDDWLLWKPSASSRSIMEIVAHSAHALGNIVMQMRGTPFSVATSGEANEGFLAHDRAFTDREQARSYLNEKCDEYVEFMTSLEEEDLDRSVAMPFGLGQAPIRMFMTAGKQHTLGHIAQIEYIQTMYGDHDWHTGF